MTAELSGKFNYNDLKAELRNGGIKTTHLSSALKKVAADNNIDDIKSLNGETEITISKSIFEEAQNTGATSPFETNTDELLLPFAAKNIQGKSENELPEIYNDDEYEVVDYEEFYNFNSAENQTEGSIEDKNDKQNEKQINFDEFKTEYGEKYAANIEDENAKEDVLKKAFAGLDVNADNFLSQSELSGAYYSSLFNPNKFDDYKNLTSNDEQDMLMSQDMMNMDMQNDSFNPQG